MHTSFPAFSDQSTKVKEEINHIKEEPKPKEEEICYKEENSTDDDDEERLVIKDEPNSQDEAEEQNVSAASSCDYNLSQFKKEESQFEVSEEEETEHDISQDEDFKVEPKEEEESDEDVPLVSTMSRDVRIHHENKRKVTVFQLFYEDT